MAKTRTQQKDDVRVELADYVQFRRRTGRPLTFAAALSGHHRICAENADKESDGYWRERMALLDEIARDEGFVTEMPDERYR